MMHRKTVLKGSEIWIVLVPNRETECSLSFLWCQKHHPNRYLESVFPWILVLNLGSQNIFRDLQENLSSESLRGSQIEAPPLGRKRYNPKSQLKLWLFEDNFVLIKSYSLKITGPSGTGQSTHSEQTREWNGKEVGGLRHLGLEKCPIGLKLSRR